MSKGRHRKRARPAAPLRQEQQPTIWRSPTPQPAPLSGQAVSEEVQRLRWWFLQHLNDYAPHFWMLLHRDVWRAVDEKAALARWAALVGVRDPWFLEAAEDTLRFWNANPEESQAIFWRGAITNLKPFTPMLSDALAKQGEDPKAFANRMRAQFEAQMKTYMNEYELGHGPQQTYFDRFLQAKNHMLWVVLRFAGVPIETVLERWPGAHLYEDPKATITRKTNELALKIGLTLRPWTRK